MAKLFVLSGDDVGRTYDVTGDQVVLGRGKEADLVVRGLSVSRKHARLERGTTGWRIVDMGSANGIRLSGMKVAEGDLVDGETFHLGDVELRFRGDGSQAEPIAPQAIEAQPIAPQPIEPQPIEPVSAPSPPAPEPQPSADEDFDLEGDWNADAPVEVQPVRSAPQPKPQARPDSQAAKRSSARRAEALGGAQAGAGGVRETAGGKRVLQYNKVENRTGMLGADLSQQGSGTRWVLYGLVVVAFAALAYGAYSLTAASKRSAAELEAEPE